jgi:signal peptidase I
MMNAMPMKQKLLRGVAVALLGAAVVVKMFFIGYYNVPQNGMYPALPKGSRLFTLRHAYGSAADVKPGDVIVFDRVVEGQTYHYIWRVIGRPGDVVVAKGRELSVNGRAMERGRFRQVGGQQIYEEVLGAVRYEVAFDDVPKKEAPAVSLTVPAGHFFVMGDNRDDAMDSRYFGTVPFESIIGRKW